MIAKMTAESNDPYLTNIGTISENSHSSFVQDPSASAEPIEEGRTVNSDFEDGQRGRDSKDNPSSPPTTNGPSDDREPSSLNNANRFKTQWSSNVPPIAIQNTNAEAHVSSQYQRRQSAATQDTEYSGALSESDVWHKKAILSLGKHRVNT